MASAAILRLVSMAAMRACAFSIHGCAGALTDAGSLARSASAPAISLFAAFTSRRAMTAVGSSLGVSSEGRMRTSRDALDLIRSKKDRKSVV